MARASRFDSRGLRRAPRIQYGRHQVTDPVTPLTPAQTALQEAKAAKEGYLRRLPVALDIFASELADDPMNMTISTSWGIAALGRSPSNPTQKIGKVRQSLAAAGCKFLNLFQTNHDPKAAAGDDWRGAHIQKLLKLSGIIS